MKLKDHERAQEVKVYRIYKYCPGLGCEGDMLPTGKLLLVYPKEYEHRCEKCGYTKYFTETYPKIVHEEIET